MLIYSVLNKTLIVLILVNFLPTFYSLGYFIWLQIEAFNSLWSHHGTTYRSRDALSGSFFLSTSQFIFNAKIIIVSYFYGLSWISRPICTSWKINTYIKYWRPLFREDRFTRWIYYLIIFIIIFGFDCRCNSAACR